MAARDQSLPVVDFFSADSSSHSELMDRESSAFQQVKRPPPVALSLRTRESSALALKHIFEQIYSSADSTPNNILSNNNGRAFEKKDETDVNAIDKDAPSPAVFQGARNHVSPPAWQANSIPEELPTRIPEMDCSFAKIQPTINLGAPGPVSPLQNASIPVYQTHLSQAISRNPGLKNAEVTGSGDLRPVLSSLPVRQPTAQLTIFYSGTVNVYDDVPADKANAIMLLAGTGNSWSMKPGNEAEKEKNSARLNTQTPPARVDMQLPPASPMTVCSSFTTATTVTSKIMGLNVPFNPNLMANTPINNICLSPISSSAPVLPPEVNKPQAALKRPNTGIELPHARKASLARFLEKRKDRVQVKQQQAEGCPQSEEKSEMKGDQRLSSPKRTCLTGLSSSTSNVKQ